MTTSNTNKIPKVCKVLGHWKALDFEWDYLTHRLLAASFVDNLGRKVVYMNFRSEITLIEKILIEILESDYTIGWNSSSSIDKSNRDETFAEDNNARTDDTQCDLGILYERCKANNIENIVTKSVTPNRTYYRINGLKHIDLYQVYSKVLVRDTIYSHKYRTNKLDDVSKGLLGYGKFKGYSGKDFLKLSMSNRRKYVLRDSELVMELVKYRDYELLDAMLAIAEITGLEFDHVCRTNLTTWWGAIYRQMIKDGECPEPFNIFSKKDKMKFKGALVLDPKPGFYHNVVMADAKSLYPSMVLTYNCSFDSVNCKCCRYDKRAKPKINSRFFEGCKYISKTKCWICRKRDGAFKKKLLIFRRERFEQKRLGNKAKDLAIKLLMNGGFGCFGHPKFDYYNPMVAEFVTTFGRYTLSRMQSIAKKLDFGLLYGDTDSLLLNNPPSEKALIAFQQICAKKLDVELEIKRRYRLCLLSAGKKHYIGIGVDDEGKEVFEKVGFEGKKSDRCAFFQQVFDDVINSIFKYDSDPIPKLTKAMSNLVAGKVAPNLLSKSIKLGQHPKEYPSQTCQPAVIGKALNAKKGELIEFFNANVRKTGKSWSRNPRDIDIVWYKQHLWNVVSEVLELAGYPVQKLAKKFGVTTPKRNNGHGVESLLVA